MTKAFKQGHAAFKQGVNIINNPYTEIDTYKAREWRKGWLHGQNVDNLRKLIDDV